MNWTEIKDTVEASGNLWTTTMGTLREAQGAGRLGIHVCSEISNTLAEIGLGHVPARLQSDQNASVRLYKRGTPVGTLIERVLHPSPDNDTFIKDRITNSEPQYESIVEQIRDLLDNTTG